MKKPHLIFILFLNSFISNAINVTEIQVKFDTSQFRITNHFSINLLLIGKRGSTYTLNRNDGDLKWEKIKIKGKHIQYMKEGVVTFNQKEVTELDNEILIDVLYNDSVFYRQKIKLPFVKELIIKNDKIYLNSNLNALDYLLVFNNGSTQDPSPELFDIDNIYNATPNIEFTNGVFNMTPNKNMFANHLDLILKNRLNHTVLATKSLPFTYGNKARIVSTGSRGRDGRNGKPTNSISNNGEDGEDGEKGEDAVAIAVFAKIVRKDSMNLILIYAKYKDGRSQNFTIDCDTSSVINIEANGGNGGNGGAGGAGGPGNTESPKGGNGGYGGYGGYGGKGANVNVYLDEFSSELISKFQINNESGSIGNAGKGGDRGVGNNENNGLLGMLLNTNHGLTGEKAQNGQFSNIEFDKTIQVISSTEWEKLLSQSK